MSKKWYNYFVSVDAGNPDACSAETKPRRAPALRARRRPIADIAASVKATPTFTQPVADPTSFEQIYQAAEIRTPGPRLHHLQDRGHAQERAHPQPAVEIKRSSVLLALDAAGVKLQEIIEDAVRRDRALDTFETGAAARARSTGSQEGGREQEAPGRKPTACSTSCAPTSRPITTRSPRNASACRPGGFRNSRKSAGSPTRWRPSLRKTRSPPGPPPAPAKPERITRPLAGKEEHFHVQSAVTNISFVLRIFHFRRGESRTDPGAEHPRHERPGAAHEREHRDGEGQRDAARKRRSQVQGRRERPDDEGEGRHSGRPRRPGRPFAVQLEQLRGALARTQGQLADRARGVRQGA